MAAASSLLIGGLIATELITRRRDRDRMTNQRLAMEKQAKEQQKAEMQSRQINRERKDRVMTRRKKMFETGTGVSITAPGMRGSGVAGTTLGGSGNTIG